MFLNKLITTRKLIALLMFLAIPTIHASSISELQTLLNNIKSMQAEFKQTVYSEQKKVVQTYNGNMVFKKPNQFRWEVTKPDPSLLITDGNKLWNYDVLLEQVTVQKYTANKDLTPLSIVLDASDNLTINFLVERQTFDCYKLTPVQENANFVNMGICFKKGVISTVNVLDHLGQNSKFEFSRVKNNISIGEKQFAFKPPAGVDVIGE
jgi:outer membrane lipoprotein carrier protein